MRIQVVGINYAPEVTGIAPYTTGLAEGLAERGHHVDVVTGLPHYPEWKVADGWESSAGSSTTVNGVRVSRVSHFVPSGSSLKARSRMEVSFGRRAVLVRTPRPDVILAVTPALAATAMVVARARIQRVPVGLIVQDLYGLGVSEIGAGGGMLPKVASKIEAGVFRQATGISVIHDHFRKSVVAMGIDEERVAVIRNWSHLDSSDATGPVADPIETRQRFGWRDDETIVLHTGNMGQKQGLDNVVEAARAAESRGLPVRFVLVGDGNQRARLDASAEGLRQFEMIRPLPDADYRAVLAAADLLLVNELPGVSGMAVPSKLTTYFSAGRPVVGAVDGNGVTASEINSSGAGIVVPAGDPIALAERSHQLAADGDRCAAFAAAGPAYAASVLGSKNAIDDYEQWCLKLLSRNTVGVH